MLENICMNVKRIDMKQELLETNKCRNRHSKIKEPQENNRGSEEVTEYVI